MKKHKCDKCENGKIEKYLHVDNGFCWKCNGSGKLNYDPKPKGSYEECDFSDADFENQDRLAREERIASRETWMALNNMFEDEDENYYHG